MEKVEAPTAHEPYVLYDVTDGVATITLNRPAELNPISHGPRSMQGEIVERLQQADLRVMTRVNGETMQDCNTGLLIHSLEKISRPSQKR